MPECHIVECYWPGVTEAGLVVIARQVEAATERLSHEGRAIRFLTGLVILEDEVAMCLFESESREIVEEACRRGGLPLDRILAVAVISPDASTRTS